jgi:hypothetical protein
MLMNKGIINSAMRKRRYAHRKAENQFSIAGEYARNLQFAYSKNYSTRGGRVEDLIYFAVDVSAEILVIGLYRENLDIENGVYINTSTAIPLQRFNAEELNWALDKLIVPVKDSLK